MKRVLQKLFGGEIVGRFYVADPCEHRNPRGSVLAPNGITYSLYDCDPETFETIFASSHGDTFVEWGVAVRRSDGHRVELILQRHADGEVLVVERPIEGITEVA